VIGGEQGRVDVLPDPPIRLVVTLAFFVLHHPALLVEFRLGDGAEEMAHAVGFQPQGAVQRVARHRLEIVGAVEPGGGIEIRGAEALQRAQVFTVVVLRALEHQVLEQVGKAGAATHFVLRADVVPDVDRDDRRLVVLVNDHGEPVVHTSLR
jgi:hypothetical protein